MIYVELLYFTVAMSNKIQENITKHLQFFLLPKTYLSIYYIPITTLIY